MTTADAAPGLGPFQRAMRWTLLRLVFLFVAAVAAHVAALLGAQSFPRLIPITGPLLALLLVGGYRLLVRFVEARPVAELEPAAAPAALGRGALIGACLFASVYAILSATHHLTFLGRGTLAGLAGALGIHVLAATGEEIIMRGVVFRVLEDGFGTTAALLFSAGLFGLMHGGNAGATTVSTLAIALEAGLLLAAAYTATRTLWLPIGLHFGWNFTEGGVFGAAVSGGESKGLLRFDVTGSDLVTGGAFGPEASVIAVIVCVAAAIAFGVLAVRRGRWSPARLAMRLP